MLQAMLTIPSHTLDNLSRAKSLPGQEVRWAPSRPPHRTNKKVLLDPIRQFESPDANNFQKDSSYANIPLNANEVSPEFSRLVIKVGRAYSKIQRPTEAQFLLPFLCDGVKAV